MGDLGVMYFMSMDQLTGKLAHLRMTPMQMRNFKPNRASSADAEWLENVLNRERAGLGARVDLDQECPRYAITPL